jgi:hypothetical protein
MPMRPHDGPTVTSRDRARPAMGRCALLASLFAGLVLLSNAAGAEGIRAAVFDLDFVDTSQEGASGKAREDEAVRLAMVGDTLRRMLAERGITIVDITPSRAKIEQAAPLTRC